ncbi:MAG TPA: ABC transporter permease [Dehalococcoidia bacterium]|jgi:peptide/nickel transport system permease protein|nr:ABC transporter permease [Dehalococcoidia bacterium]
MAVSELGSIAEIEGWTQPKIEPLFVRMMKGLWKFTRRKPLGAVCGFIVVFFFIVGDVVPETINKVARTAGVADHPVPYVADQLEQAFSFIYPYSKQDLRARLEGSSGKHLLGTDAIGRDILSRLLYGARTAVMVSFGAVAINQLIGASIGIMSGYYGGWVDKGLYRVCDVFQALPGLVVLITVLGIFGSGLWQLVFVIGLYGGPIQSRVIRGQAVYVMASPFIEAARVIGASDRRIMVRYLLPNVMPLIILNATVSLGFIVLLEASLSFLGYGLPPPFPSWGQMLSLEGRQYMRTQPGLAIYPGVAIGILVFSFNLFGDALRDVLDPRLRGSK